MAPWERQGGRRGNGSPYEVAMAGGRLGVISRDNHDLPIRGRSDRWAGLGEGLFSFDGRTSPDGGYPWSYFSESPC